MPMKLFAILRVMIVGVCVGACVSLSLTQTAYAKALSPYDTLTAAQAQTHKDGPFRLQGTGNSVLVETAGGKTAQTPRQYTIDGYDLNASETLIQFQSRTPSSHTGGVPFTRTSFLITPDQIYSKTTSPPTDWVGQDIMTMVPKFISLGALDQFFMLELLNGDRLSFYQDYLTLGKEETVEGVTYATVKADISREQFARLSEALTTDMKVLLGTAADGMSAAQLAFAQTFARGMLLSLDAEAHYTFYIDKETGRIARILTRMDMANPYGSRAPGVVSRIQSDATVTLKDFGQAVERVSLPPS